MKILAIILLLLPNLVFGQSAKRSTLYLLIEPSVYFADKFRIASSIIEQKSRLKATTIVLHVMGHNEIFDRKKATKKKLKKLLNKHKNNKQYDISHELNRVGLHLQDMRKRGDKTLLVMLGDFTLWRTDGSNTHGYFMNDAWLTSEYSPFVRNFIRNDNSILAGLKVVVLGQQTLSAFVHNKHETFIAKLFNEASNRIQFMGYFSSKNQMNPKLTQFSLNLVKYSLSNSSPIKPGRLDSSQLFQFIRDDATSIDIKAAEVRAL